jgi:hypothetical protein
LVLDVLTSLPQQRALADPFTDENIADPGDEDDAGDPGRDDVAIRAGHERHHDQPERRRCEHEHRNGVCWLYYERHQRRDVNDIRRAAGVDREKSQPEQTDAGQIDKLPALRPGGVHEEIPVQGREDRERRRRDHPGCPRRALDRRYEEYEAGVDHP